MSNRKLRLSIHRKNEKRKKYGFFPVRIPLSEALSILTVSVSLDQLPLKVSLPLKTYEDLPSSSLATLHSRLAVSKILPQGIAKLNLKKGYTDTAR